MWAREVFRVLYSPLKAFREIVSKPDVKGPILILVLTLATTAVAQYASLSKLSIETPPSSTDDWWEKSITNWKSNGEVTKINNTDHIFLCNYSIQSSIFNETLIWMNKTDIGSFNCLEGIGYKALSFRIKWIRQDGNFPNSSATLQLFSLFDENRYFKLNLTDLISNSTNTWANITVNIGPEASEWLQQNSPSWENITGIKFEIGWSDIGNLTMIITDLFFGKYTSLLATNMYSSMIPPLIIDSIFSFFITWAIFAGSLILCAVTLRQKVGSWKTFFIVIGYVFSVTIVYIIVRTLMISALPDLKLQYEAWKAWEPNATEAQIIIANDIVTQQIKTYWGPSWIYLVGSYLIFAIDAWTVALSVIAIHSLREISWKKAMAIALLGYVVYFLLRGLLLV